MSSIDELRAAYEGAETEAVRLSNEYANARAALKGEYDPQIRQANQQLVDTQKAYADAEAAAVLVGREDGKELASSLGLTWPEEA